jgi:hypothetical protein
MSSRTLISNTSVIKTHPNGTPDIQKQLVNVKSLTSTDTLEFWGDGGIWDVTTGKPVSVDIFAITGTPRKVT